MEVIKSPIKAIRAKRLDCCAGSQKEVELCTCVKCPLRPFRFGHNVFHSRASEKQKARVGIPTETNAERI